MLVKSTIHAFSYSAKRKGLLHRSNILNGVDYNEREKIFLGMLLTISLGSRLGNLPRWIYEENWFSHTASNGAA